MTWSMLATRLEEFSLWLRRLDACPEWDQVLIIEMGVGVRYLPDAAGRHVLHVSTQARS